MREWAWLPPAALGGLWGSLGKGRAEPACGSDVAGGGGPAKGVRMRRAWMMAVAGILFLLFLAVPSLGQTMSKITVTGSEVITGVVIVHLQWQGQGYELQCNQNISSCRSLKKGDYTMVELPKNFGIYECRGVEVYPQSTEPVKGAKLGEYCLVRP